MWLLNSFNWGIYRAALLNLPTYYASCAAPILRALIASQARLGSVVVFEAPECVIMQPERAHLGTSVRSSSTFLTDTLKASRVFNAPSRGVELAWGNFIARCQAEWIFISSVAFTFVMASPAALQAFSSDPLTRSLTFVAIFQAICAIMCSMTHFVFFRDPETRTPRFARVWFQDVGKHADPVRAAPWGVLSLPMASLCWGAIAFLIALVSSMWHGNHVCNPISANVPLTIGLVPQVLITALCVVDAACLFWIVVTFKKAKLCSLALGDMWCSASD